MEEKEKFTEELEQEVEKALDEILSGAKKRELTEEETESYALLEPVEEDETLQKELEELIGEILTIEWEIIPEIAEEAYNKCRKLRSSHLDPTTLKLLDFLERVLEEVRSPEKVEARHLELIKKAGDILYRYKFENLPAEEVLEELKVLSQEEEVIREETKEEEPELELELELEPEKPSAEAEPVMEKEKEETPSPISPPSAPGFEEKFFEQLLRTYERIVAVEELLKEGLFKGSRKLLLKARKEIEDFLGENYQEELREREKRIQEFLRQQEKKVVEVPPLEKVLWCQTLSQELFIPLDEVAFTGEIKDYWRRSLSEGIFPLKLLKGGSFWRRWFGKIGPKLQGELAQKSEKELANLVFKTNKPLTSETQLVLLWKEGKGLALLVNEYKIESVDSRMEWLPAEPPFIGKTIKEGSEIFLFSVTHT